MSEKETYSLFISSTDKISGTNNNGQYNINWDDFLPRGYNFFKMIFNFQTSGGYYKDFTNTITTQATAAAVTSFVATVTQTTLTTTTASTTVTLSAANSNILVGMTVSNANIIGSCVVSNIVGTSLFLSSAQTIPSGQTLSFNFASSTSVLLSASNSNILVGMNVTNASIIQPCYVAAISGPTLTLTTSQTIAAAQTLTFIFTNSTSVVLSAANANIAVGQSVSNGSINQPCFVTAINGTLLTLSSPQTITTSQTLTFNTINVFAAGKVVFNTGGKSHSFDTKSCSQSSTIGYIQRDIQISGSSSNTLSCFFSQNAPKTISRPNQNVSTITIYNTCYTTASNSLLVDTNAAGNALLSDMNNWNMIIQFIPIEDSIQPLHVNF